MTTRRTSRFVPLVMWSSVLLASVLPVRAEQPAKIAKPLAQGSVVLSSALRSAHPVTPVPNYGRSAFSCEHGERSDVRPGKARNRFDLHYGIFSLNGDADWFTTEFEADDRSRIRNLGALEWRDLGDLPEIEPNDKLYGLSVSDDDAELEQLSHGTTAKAREGHIYLIRTKNSHSDLVSLVRVDRLVPGKTCRITWRLVENRKSLATSPSEPK